MPTLGPAPDGAPEKAERGDAADASTRNKEESPFMDVFAAWGWSNHSYLVTACPLGLSLRAQNSDFAFHARFVSLGAFSFEQNNLHGDGSKSSERRTTFALELLSPGVRAYFIGPIYWAASVSFGAVFYDGLVPTLDVQSGFGYHDHGWGFEAGVRTNRVPREQMMIDGERFLRERATLLAYLSLETNFRLGR